MAHLSLTLIPKLTPGELAALTGEGLLTVIVCESEFLSAAVYLQGENVFAPCITRETLCRWLPEPQASVCVKNSPTVFLLLYAKINHSSHQQIHQDDTEMC